MGINKSWIIAFFFGPKVARQIRSLRHAHRQINLTNPVTLADKISWLEFNGGKHLQWLMTQCTDKIAVRDYVTSVGLEKCLIPIVGGPWTDANAIDFESLPRKFAMKAAHGCGMNMICDDKYKIDVEEYRSIANYWLKHNYEKAIFEPHYLHVPHRIYCEKYLGAIDSVIDYKFFCLNGVPKVVLTTSGRDSCLLRSVHDMNWNDISEYALRDVPIASDHTRPCQFEAMKTIAARLSEEFDFVRVDLYQGEDEVLFGELTFTPYGGVLEHYSDEFHIDLGRDLVITELSKY